MKRTIGIVLAGPAALAMGVIAFAQAQDPSLAELLERFQHTTTCTLQFEVAKQIAKVGDARALQVWEPWLGQEDRHLRACVGVGGRLN